MKTHIRSFLIATTLCLNFGQVFGQATNSCNLLPNPSFEDQNVTQLSGSLDNVFPSSLNELSGWRATNGRGASYYATNSPTGSSSNPYSSPTSNSSPNMGPFPPYNYSASLHNGAAGIYLHGAATGEPREYITPSSGPISLSAGNYYASFLAYRSPSGTDAMKLGMNFTLANPVTNDVNAVFPRATGTSIESSTYLQNSSWTPVTGQFTLSTSQAGQYYVNIGNLSPTDQWPNHAGSVMYAIDEVELYKIPTAGLPSSINCSQSVTLGEGCLIPGASYTWSASGMTPITSTTTIQQNFIPTATTTYTLTVKLPDNSTSASTVLVTVSTCPAVTGNPSGPVCPGTDLTYSANSSAVTWSTSPAGFFTPATGSGSTFGTRVAAGASGQGTITATFTGLAGQPSVSNTVTVGTPPIPQITVDHDGTCTDNSQYFRILNYDNQFTYHIVVTSFGSNALPSYLGHSYTNSSGTVVTPQNSYLFRIKGGSGVTDAYFTVTATNASGSSTCSSTTGELYASYPNCTFLAASTVYPNPANESVTIPEGATDAVLLNSQGKAVAWADKAGKLDTQRLPAGLYNLQLQHNGKRVNQRIEVKH